MRKLWLCCLPKNVRSCLEKVSASLQLTVFSAMCTEQLQFSTTCTYITTDSVVMLGSAIDIEGAEDLIISTATSHFV